MKSTSILLLLVALMLPTRSEAFLAEIFSFIIGIFIPDWQGQLCDALTANIPQELGACGCEVNLSGLFDFNVGGTCEDVADVCDITLGGDGNIFTAVFTGVELSAGTECDLGQLGTINLAAGGTLSIDDSDIDSCSFSYTAPVLGLLSCECTPDCDANDAFAVGVSCLNIIDFPCINFLSIITAVAGLPPPTLPPARE